ncbi:phosphate ABC transporter permease PstA [Thermobrachium celere]|uniref:Phosphate transport system permease protein PstA n=1 Tax=Thermobrachium celere DSM 8682 TaxID=941824 RepID=R7RUC3_9CLOT|nr:phosphate ABC transporter permease PstA [Thermobrachium celere]GFR34939.1 phosphate transport system permease protein PstA [Thermobrachium celere]CDF58940.1 Phosphate transport system permease protein PstA (TC 3.A.1.7.1) [Thermobrachium celere DSM 8682]
MNSEELRRLKRRKMLNSIMHVIFLACTLFGVVVLAILMLDILRKGIPWLSLDFLKNFPSRFPRKSGIYPALLGSLWVILLTALIAFPVGVGTAIYLEEYAEDNKFTEFIKLNIANLAGVPSIIYGMLGLAVFVRLFSMGRTILAAAFTMAILILPIIIISSQEAIKSVPSSLKQASYALGTTKWQTVTGVILPYALPGILTGSILAVSRALGEAAPLIVVGALAYVSFIPKGPLDQFTVLPIQIFNWAGMPKKEFQDIAAAGIIVLLVILLGVNSVAIILRNKYQIRMKD